MMWEGARDALGEIKRRRFLGDLDGVQELAGEVWTRAAGWDREQRIGLAGVCQATFVALVGAGDEAVRARATLWRARATRVAAETGEVATAPMLLIPLAAEAAMEGNLQTALDVLDEVGAAAADVVERRGDHDPAELAVLRRTQREKQGHLLGRAGRHAEAVERYEAARAIAAAGRDLLRVRGGLERARLCADLQAGRAIDREAVVAELRAIAAEARAGGWLDVAEPAGALADSVAGSAPLDARTLPTFEVEPGRSPPAPPEPAGFPGPDQS